MLRDVPETQCSIYSRVLLYLYLYLRGLSHPGLTTALGGEEVA